MQFCKLDGFNLAYLYVLHILTKHFARLQNCFRCHYLEKKPIKIKYKAENEENSQKGTRQLKMKETVAKKKKKKKRK